MPNQENINNASVAPAFVNNANGTVTVTFAHSQAVELSELFNKLNEVSMSDQGENMKLFFEMVEQFTTANPDKGVAALRLNRLFSGLMATIGRLGETIDLSQAGFETAISVPAIGNPFSVEQVSAEVETDQLHETVNGYLSVGGTKQPIRIIDDLVNNFFTALDPDEKDINGKHVACYKCYNPEYIQEIVFASNKLKEFITNIGNDVKMLQPAA